MTTSTDSRKLAIRAAAKIHARLCTSPRLNCVDRLPGGGWERLRSAVWRHRKVDVRGWHAAAASLVDDLDYQTGLLITELKHFRDQLSATARSPRIAGPGQILADLLALENEFESVQIDLKEGTVTAQTEPIELEGLWLGPFNVRLWWERLGLRPAYEVIAIDPQYPARDDSVTHPHVQERQLCEGEATLPIKAALTEGRLFDFFLLVRQTLQTYNESSPYVRISEWDGRHCKDCGWSMDAESASTCGRCDEHVCDECSRYCRSCDRYACSACTEECAECENTFCSECLTLDTKTRRLLCQSCLDQGTSDEDEDQCEGAAPAADAVCLGQTAAAA
ncbi:MAG: hypothetical protein L0211_24530 [Planctomycetaceae bacterium]|nr:hypothetical protein [Planctomycetaceae bacterium]